MANFNKPRKEKSQDQWDTPHELKKPGVAKYFNAVPIIRTKHFLLYNREGEWKVEREFDNPKDAVIAAQKSRIGMAVSRRNLPDGGMLQKVLFKPELDYVCPKRRKETIEPDLPPETDTSWRERAMPYTPPVIRDDFEANTINRLLESSGQATWERLATLLDKPEPATHKASALPHKELTLVRLGGTPYFVAFDRPFAEQMASALKRKTGNRTAVEPFGMPTTAEQAFSDIREAAKMREAEYTAKLDAAMSGKHFDGRLPSVSWMPPELAWMQVCQCCGCQNKRREAGTPRDQPA